MWCSTLVVPCSRVLGIVYYFLSNGVGRTGVFIALHIVLERLVVEGLVDIFQTVKNLRIQRSAMVQSLVRQKLQFVTVEFCFCSANYVLIIICKV